LSRIRLCRSQPGRSGQWAGAQRIGHREREVCPATPVESDRV